MVDLVNRIRYNTLLKYKPPGKMVPSKNLYIWNEGLWVDNIAVVNFNKLCVNSNHFIHLAKSEPKNPKKIKNIKH